MFSKGISRRFAYIGYKAEQEAQKAISHFNGTFIDTSRIVVELAKAVSN
jgi:multiple RNA-binding domain-containing protein 1